MFEFTHQCCGFAERHPVISAGLSVVKVLSRDPRRHFIPVTRDVSRKSAWHLCNLFLHRDVYFSKHSFCVLFLLYN